MTEVAKRHLRVSRGTLCWELSVVNPISIFRTPRPWVSDKGAPFKAGSNCYLPTKPHLTKTRLPEGGTIYHPLGARHAITFVTALIGYYVSVMTHQLQNLWKMNPLLPHFGWLQKKKKKLKIVYFSERIEATIWEKHESLLEKNNNVFHLLTARWSPTVFLITPRSQRNKSLSDKSRLTLCTF